MSEGTNECDSELSGTYDQLVRGWSRPSRSSHRLSVVVVLVSTLLLLFVPQTSSANEYVDGISDQSLPNWDSGFSGSYFAGFFANTWMHAGHIGFARYVVQWNVMRGSGEPYNYSRQQFAKWVEDAGSMGLTLDVSLTSYNGVYPSSSSEYKERLKEVLNEAKALGYPARYVES